MDDLNEKAWPPKAEDLTPPRFACDPSDLPDDLVPEASIWRYMDLAKLLALLETESLFMARADHLGDHFEGSMPAERVAKRSAFWRELSRRGEPVPLMGDDPDMVRDHILNSVVSCWHMNELESAAMWKLYLSYDVGVAVRSTIARLAGSFPRYDGVDKGFNDDNTEAELLIRLGRVRYVDFHDEERDLSVPDTEASRRAGPRLPRTSGDLLWLKRNSFQHEREVRAVARDFSFMGDPGRPTRFAAGGASVPVHLGTLVGAIYVAPDAPRWFADLVRRLVGRYGLEVEVRQSDLARDPLY